MLVKQLTDTEIFTIVKAAVDSCYLDLVWKFPEQHAYDATVNGVTDWLQENAPLFDADNLKKAFEKGILREYGEYHGLSKVTFVMFIKAFTLATAPPKTNKDTTMIKTKPMLPEQFATMKDVAIMAFESYKNENLQRSSLPLVHDSLKSIGLINYSKEIRSEMWGQAKVNVIARYKGQKNSLDLFMRQAVNSMIERFELGPDENTKEFNEMVAEGKKLTCIKYFDDLILTGSNLSELVESKREVFYNLKSK